MPTPDKSIDDMHRVKFIHEAVHDRLINWARWCNGGRGGSSSAPMFRHYRAPKYQNAADQIRIPVDGLDAADIEKIVGLLPDKHRDAIRYFYVYSHRGMGLWQAVRGLAVTRDTLVRLIHDGRSMVKNRLDSGGIRARIAPKFNSAPAASASLREAEVPVKRTERPTANA